MKRLSRVAIEIILPPLLGLFFALLGAVFYSDVLHGRNDFRELFSESKKLLIPAYIVTGFPAVIYAAIMEISFELGLRVNSWRSVAVSSVLGMLAGVAMALLISSQAGDFILLSTDGLAVGFVCGCLLRFTTPR